MPSDCLEFKLGLKAARAEAAALLAGTSPVSLRGLGLEYIDFREYEPGDDARFIDWRLSARSLGLEGWYRLLVKVFRAERMVRAVLAVDLSASISFGRKVRALAYASSVISTAAKALEDELALVVWQGGRAIAYPWMRPDRAPYILLRRACEEGCSGAADLTVLAKAASKFGAPTILFTDYANELESFEQAVEVLRGRGLGLVLVYEPHELRPPLECLASIADPETGSTASGGLAEVYSRIKLHVSRVRALLEGRVPALEASWPAVRGERARLAQLYLAVRRRLPLRHRVGA